MKLVWDEITKRLFETGVSMGVLYPVSTLGTYPKGVAWSGLTAVTESPSGAEASPIYADNIKYLNMISAEDFGATIEAYMYPDEFAECDGSAALAVGVSIGQQKRRGFGFCYKTVLGNDTEMNDYGYKLHLIYGAIAAPSEKSYSTVNESPEAMTLSWEITTTPVPVTGFKPAACLTIDSTKVNADKLAALEAILFGTEGTDARLPLPDEVLTLMAEPLPSALALSAIVPDDEATAVAIDSNIVMTFNNKIDKESIIVASEADGVVAGTKSWDATGKILTFNPTANLSTSTSYIVTLGGVVDIYGQALTATVKNFTTTPEK